MNSGDTAWMLASTALVMIMLPGLALFYGGLVRAKNVLSTVMHSFFGLALVSIVWVVIGFTLAFGPNAGQFEPLTLKELADKAPAMGGPIGAGVQLNTAGAEPDRIRFYPSGAGGYGCIDALTSGTGNAGIMMYSSSEVTNPTQRGIVIAREDYASLIWGTPDLTVITTDIFALGRRFISCLPLRVSASTASPDVTNPRPSLDATSIFESGRTTNMATISLSASRSIVRRIGSPNPRPPGSLSPPTV